MRYSRQRDEVLYAVLSSCNHPDAKEVYNMVKEKIPNVSLGTVYRNLNMLVDEKKIKKVFMKDGNDRFDKTLINHNHIICECCGKVRDVNLSLKSNEIREVENQTRFKITDCNFNINGICNDCMKGRNC